jgi:hypothetical protein
MVQGNSQLTHLPLCAIIGEGHVLVQVLFNLKNPEEHSRQVLGPDEQLAHSGLQKAQRISEMIG